MPLIIENSWKAFLENELKQPYMKSLSVFLKNQKKTGRVIYPKASEIFRAFELTPLDKTKVVIIGQDPYHGPNQAHGLCFSVQNGVQIPPSLGNIYKELQDDLKILPAKHGNLTAWTKQGVLLLNSVLTVEQAKPAAHQNKGWEQFTDKVIELINKQEQPVVFVLWGAYAQQKGKMIDRNKHLVIPSAHPSPLSAYRGFFGSRPFSQINEFLIKLGQNPIDWHLPELS
jgi:uracil-DNA glycosylase